MIQLRHIALRCVDVEKSRRFYELLGMTFIAYRPVGDGALDLTDGTVNMTLIPHKTPRPQFEEGNEYIHFGVIVDDTKKMWAKLIEAGAPILRDDIKLRNPVTEPPEGSFKVADPDGNVVDIADNREEWRGIRLDPA